jgi:hypothetical protein
MAWRNKGVTGSNNTPLGARRRFGDDPTDSADSHEAPPYESGSKRGRSPIAGNLPPFHVSSRRYLTLHQISIQMAPNDEESEIDGETRKKTKLPVSWDCPLLLWPI